MKTKVDKAAIANAAFTNPAVLYALVAIVVVGGVWFFGPGLFDSLKRNITGAFDNVLSSIADIFGRPASQDPAKRKAADSVRGLAVEGDRALSDLYDQTFGRVFN